MRIVIAAAVTAFVGGFAIASTNDESSFGNAVALGCVVAVVIGGLCALWMWAV